MLKKIAASMLALGGLVVCQSTFASTTITATLTNGAENPPVNPTTTGGQARSSSGTATFVLNDAQTAMTFTCTITGIDVTGSQTADTNDNLVNAHIHAGPNTAPTNNSVVWGFFGSPFNDNNPNDFSLVPTPGGVGGTFSGKWDAPEGNNTTLTAQIANILAGNGRAYINFHTTQFAGGEIRGNFVVPEPASALILGGAAGAMMMRRRRLETPR